MTREQALELLQAKIKNENLRRHCYAVEAAMEALYEELKKKGKNDLGSKEDWMMSGLIHDVDYEETKDNAQKDHTKLASKWLERLNATAEIQDAVATHAWNYVEGAPKPSTPMQWSLYCVDELTGLIVAVALVKPDKRLASVSVNSVVKKWSEKSFAAGVDREQIEMCEDMLDIALPEFISITLRAMQSIHEKLGL